MRDNFETFSSKNAEILAISFSDADRVRNLAEYLKLPFPIACDVEKKAYAAYAMQNGSFWQVWHPKIIVGYLGRAVRGEKAAMSQKGDDLSQMGGDFVIGGDGTLLFAHSSKRADLRPQIPELLASLPPDETQQT